VVWRRRVITNRILSDVRGEVGWGRHIPQRLKPHPFCDCYGWAQQTAEKTRMPVLKGAALSFAWGQTPRLPSRAKLGFRSYRHQRCRIGRKTDKNYDYLPIGSGLSRSKLPPGWRPAAQTRASPPHQAKSGLDGDPGVWAYVGADASSARPSASSSVGGSTSNRPDGDASFC
jgi:hypothetical protein